MVGDENERKDARNGERGGEGDGREGGSESFDDGGGDEELLSAVRHLPMRLHSELFLNALEKDGSETKSNADSEGHASTSCVVVVGAPGSGKSTQLPQLLCDTGFAPVAIAQPRRVAAVMLAKRVKEEQCSFRREHRRNRGRLRDESDLDGEDDRNMNQLGGYVGYCVRFENCSSDKTMIKFFTDGCLLREVAADPMMMKYNSIIIDEAHERSVQSDILLGIIKSVTMKRKEKPIKVQISSFFSLLETSNHSKYGF